METLGQSDKTDVEKKVVSLSQDSFYKELQPDEIILANKGMFNFDHPDAFDVELMESVLQVSKQIYQESYQNLSTSGHNDWEADQDSRLRLQD